MISARAECPISGSCASASAKPLTMTSAPRSALPSRCANRCDIASSNEAWANTDEYTKPPRAGSFRAISLASLRKRSQTGSSFSRALALPILRDMTLSPIPQPTTNRCVRKETPKQKLYNLNLPLHSYGCVWAKPLHAHGGASSPKVQLLQQYHQVLLPQQVLGRKL